MMNQTIQQVCTRTYLAAWCMIMALVGSTLMAGHWIDLPHPSAGDSILSVNQARYSAVDAEQLVAYHILYQNCACSRRVLNHLAGRQPVHGVSERILLVGDNQAKNEFQDSRFSLEILSPERLKAEYGVDAAPLMLVTDRSGRIEYSGGYTSRKQGYEIRDVAILDALLSGQTIESLPVYGCGVSESLKAIVDPLGLKG